MYPKFFEWSGLKGVYSRFIFNLVFFDKVFKKRRLIIKELKRKIKPNKSKINFLISPPSSGSTYLRSLLTSYFAIYHKIDNGIPKFNNLTQRWTYAGSPIVYATLFHNIDLNIVQEIKRENFFSEEEFIGKGLPFISFGKLRGSYGTTGNDQIGNYGYLDSYEVTRGPSGLYPTPQKILHLYANYHANLS